MKTPVFIGLILLVLAALAVTLGERQGHKLAKNAAETSWAETKRLYASNEEAQPAVRLLETCGYTYYRRNSDAVSECVDREHQQLLDTRNYAAASKVVPIMVDFEKLLDKKLEGVGFWDLVRGERQST